NATSGVKTLVTYGWGATAGTGTILEGQQCLVFFLQGPGGKGFSANPKDPTDASTNRLGPFFEFKSNRLVTTPSTSSAAFPAYADPFGKGVPYAYFSSGNKRNDYDRYGPAPAYAVPFSTATIRVLSDCSSLPGTPFPYAEAWNTTYTGRKFMNPEKFQIISAGPGGQFGGGTVASSASAGSGLWSAAAATH